MAAKTDLVFYLGGVFDEQTMLSSAAVSPAANRWQLGLLEGLSSAGARVVVAGHLFDRPWPLGSVRPATCARPLASVLADRRIRYWNLPVARERHLARSYSRCVDSLVCSFGVPKCVITYNDPSWGVAAALHARRRYGIPWYLVVADRPQSPNSELEADGIIYLSWHLYSKSAHKRKYHLDGGVAELRFNPGDPTTFLPAHGSVVFYSGTVWLSFGVGDLLEAFASVRTPNAELVLCGKGASASELAAIRACPARVRYLGCVTERRLVEVARTAAATVNPRPNTSEHQCNFPSKLLEYLSYGRPVVSSWTGGIAPYYRDVLIVPEQPGSRGMADAIDMALSWPRAQRKEYAERVASFLRTRKLWAVQARRLWDWLCEPEAGC